MPKKQVDEYGLSDRERRYCDEYLCDHNQTAAAIRAGYSPVGARQRASKLMTKRNVASYIETREAEISKRLGISAERTKAELAKIAYGNVMDVINTTDATVKDDANRDDTASIASVKVKVIPTANGDIVEREIKLHDKVKSLELLGKADGLFKDNLNITGEMVIFNGEDKLED